MEENEFTNETKVIDLLLKNVKKEVKQIMEESVTRKFVHEQSSSLMSLCNTVDSCLEHKLKKRSLGLFKVASSMALLQKISSSFGPALQIVKLVQMNDINRKSLERNSSVSLSSSSSSFSSSSSSLGASKRSNVKYGWIKVALFEKELVSIVEHIRINSSKYYEKEALMCDAVSGVILVSLLVGPCALEFTHMKTTDHLWSDPHAKEIMQRHRIHNPLNNHPLAHHSPPKRLALQTHKTSSSTSDDCNRVVPYMAKDYVESLHQNHTSTLLYGKNNIILQPKNDDEVMAGYLSLHQSSSCLLLKWTPNHIMNFPHNDKSNSTETTTNNTRQQSQDRSKYWNYAVTINMKDIVYLHCHQNSEHGSKVVMVGYDGVQRPPIHFSPGNSIFHFLSSIESGISTYARLEPSLLSLTHTANDTDLSMLVRKKLEGASNALSSLFENMADEISNAFNQSNDANSTNSASNQSTATISNSNQSTTTISNSNQSELGAINEEFSETLNINQHIPNGLLSDREHTHGNETEGADEVHVNVTHKQFNSNDEPANNMISTESKQQAQLMNGKQNEEKEEELKNNTNDNNFVPAISNNTNDTSNNSITNSDTNTSNKSNNKNPSESMGVTSFDYVFRIITDESINESQSEDRVKDCDSLNSADTVSVDVDHRTAVIQLCDTMTSQIISRAFYGWLSYCRQLKTVRTHLSTLVNPSIHPPIHPSSYLTKQKWHEMTKDGKIKDEHMVYNLIYYGGCQHEIRKEVWPYLLGHYEMGSSVEERTAVDEGVRKEYGKVVSQWVVCERFLKIQEKEKVTLTANISNKSIIHSFSNEVFEEENSETTQVHQTKSTITADTTTADTTTADINTANTNIAATTTAEKNTAEKGNTKAYSVESLAAISASAALKSTESRTMAVSTHANTNSAYLNGIREDSCSSDTTFLSLSEPAACSEDKSTTAEMDLSTITAKTLCTSSTTPNNINDDVTKQNDNDVIRNKNDNNSSININNSNNNINNSNNHHHNMKTSMISSANRSSSSSSPLSSSSLNKKMPIAKVNKTQLGRESFSSLESKTDEELNDFMETQTWTNEYLEELALNFHRIDKDVHRCDRNQTYFMNKNNLSKLRSIMCSYVWQNMSVGYVQGMCDLVAPLLVVLDDESLVYSCFSKLMTRMGDNFPNGGAMDMHFGHMRSLIQTIDGELYEHMKKHGDYTHFYFSYRWFLLDFKRELSYTDVFLVWETIWTARYTCTKHLTLFIAMATVEYYRDIIIDNRMDFTDIIKFFNELAEKHQAKEILTMARSLVNKLHGMIETK